MTPGEQAGNGRADDAAASSEHPDGSSSKGDRIEGLLVPPAVPDQARPVLDAKDEESRTLEETRIFESREQVLEETQGTIRTPEAAPEQVSPEERPRVGRYELLEVLGKGAFGSVYLGFDSRLNRRVAIKVSHLHIDSEHAQQEFLTEARQLAQLNHLGIVKVFDVGVEDGRCFIVSDYLDGLTLHKWLKTPQPWPECTQIVALIADALAHAHANRTVHRDLKPGNVILVNSAQGLQPVIVDFGLAVSDAQQANGTQPGDVSGTPNYMSPKQVRGEGHRIDGRTDIYSLGVIFYRMLTGRLPFASERFSELMRQVCEDDPQPPRQTVQHLPAQLEHVCLRMMARNLSDRYTTAADVAADLRQVLSTAGMQSPHPGMPPSSDQTGTSAGQATWQQGLPTANWQKPLPDAASVAAPGSPEVIAGQRSQESSDSPSGEFLSSISRRGAERRRVTLVQCSCNLYESEVIQTTLDADEQGEVLFEFQAMCRSVCREMGGTVVQETDTGLLICFGYPITYEDAVQRAIHTGRRVIEDLGPFNHRQQNQQSVTLTARVAIHSDFAVLEAKGETGDTLSLVGPIRHVVSQLDGLGEPNSVVISEATFKLVKGYFDCESMGRQSIKGVAGGMNVLTVNSVRAITTRGDANDANELTPLVGRDREIGLLQERWEQTTEEMGQVVLLIGEAGLGKSRLVHALRKHVSELADEDSNPIIEWRTTPRHQVSSLYAVQEYFERTLGFESDQSADDKLDRIADYLRDLNLDGDEEVALFASLLSVPSEDRYAPLEFSPQLQKDKTFALLLDWLKEYSSRQPVLFVVEDLHWIDPTSLEFVEKLVDQGISDSILTLLTFRPEFETPWKSKAHQTSVALNRLTKRQIGEMMALRAGMDELPQEVVDQVIDRTDGVPLFVQEFTNMLLESGTIERIRNQTADMSGSFAPIQIPATLQDLLMARLDRMASNLDVVQIGAAIGREFRFRLLCAVSPLSEDALQTELAKLVKAELLLERGRGEHVRYQFKHALIQDAAYGSLVRKKRREFHQSIAEALEAGFEEEVARQPEVLAHHFSEAGNVPRSVEYWLKAGRRATQQSANTEAIAHLSRGLELVEKLDAGAERDKFELDLRVALAIPLTTTKGYVAAEVESEYMRARELARKAGNIEDLLPVLHGLYRYYVVQADNQEARKLGEEILASAQQLDDPDHIMEAHRSLCLTLAFIGEFDQVAHHVDAGFAIYDVEAHAGHKFVYGADPGMIFLSFSSWALWNQGFPDQAYQKVQEAFQHTQLIRHPHSRAFCLSFCCGPLYHLGLWDECQAAAEESIEISVKHGFPFWIGNSTVMKGRV